MSSRINSKLSSIITGLLLVIGLCDMRAQDIHFTQFNNCIQQFNPALTGQFETMMRGTIIHKRQWRGIGSGYTTSGLDAQYKLLSLYGDNYTGFGLLILQDEAGPAQMKTFMVKGSVAYHLLASQSDLLSAGTQFGYEQRSINFDGLSWDSQYNGINYDPTLDDRERFITAKRSFVDFGAGINWKHKGKKKFSLGYSFFHAGQQITMVARGNDKLKMRHVFMGSHAKRYDHIDMKYDAMVQREAGAMEVILGITVDYRLGDDSRYTNVRTSSVIRGGCFMRFGDAMQPFVGFEYKRFFAVNLGYDIRVAKMSVVTKRPGGPEIALTYLGLPGRKRMKVVH